MIKKDLLRDRPADEALLDLNKPEEDVDLLLLALVQIAGDHALQLLYRLSWRWPHHSCPIKMMIEKMIKNMMKQMMETMVEKMMEMMEMMEMIKNKKKIMIHKKELKGVEGGRSKELKEQEHTSPS